MYVEPELGSISPGTARVTRSALRPVLAPDGDDPVGYAIEVRVVNVFGHAHPAIVEAVTRQLSTLGHVSNFFASEPQISLAERLLAFLAAHPTT